MIRKLVFGGATWAMVSLSSICCVHASQPALDSALQDLRQPELSAVQSEQIQFYAQRYQLQNLNQKLVDNLGENFDDLYGTRNFREVLRGVLYRGGANNKFNKIKKRNNMNPLQDHGIENLCEEGFAGAVYLYDANFDSAKKSVRCKSFPGENVSGNEFARSRQSGNSFTYQQLTALDANNEEKFLKMIYDAITGKIESPIYMHCWNGWHASGMVSAIALQQFCNWTPDQALTYWTQNTDGNSDGHERIKARIRGFKPYAQYRISPEMQQLVCR